ncbi:jg26960 [Pararge aegeria aegeria]|uniref:Jg26960 protein n=1 Tax=Pararge aegeria aegeria TaxID=348720 RepID=A0A8S4S1A8_9NEOP|nr:jg26960 [Pararge aegeria aegeria]
MATSRSAMDTYITKATKIRLVRALVFPIFLYASETWTPRESGEKKIDVLEMWCWRRMLRIPWNAFRTNKSILEELGIMQRLSFIGTGSYSHVLWSRIQKRQRLH